MPTSLGVIEWLLGLLAALVGVLWKILSKRIQKLEEEQMSKVMCVLHNATCEQKMLAVKDKLEDLKKANKEDHEALVATLKDISEAISDLQECVTKLSVGAKC